MFIKYLILELSKNEGKINQITYLFCRVKRSKKDLKGNRKRIQDKDKEIRENDLILINCFFWNVEVTFFSKHR